MEYKDMSTPDLFDIIIPSRDENFVEKAQALKALIHRVIEDCQEAFLGVPKGKEG